MKIKMILTNAFSIDVRVYKEARYLVTRGNEVEILCWDKTPQKRLPQTENMEGINIRRFSISAIAGSGVKQLGAYLKFLRECKKYLHDKKYDVVHCHDLDGAIIGCFLKHKLIFDMHEFYDKGSFLKAKISHFATRAIAKKAIANIYVTPLSLEAYGHGIEKKFFQLKNYSDRNSFADIEKTQSSKLRVSYIGTVRNQLTEFHSLFEAVKDIDDIIVNIYGGGVDLAELEKMALLYNNVNVYGAFNGVSESEYIYKNTDVSYIAYSLTNPNYHGDFEPVKLYEAIATETPIVATKGLNIGRVALKYDIGKAVDTQNIKQIRQAFLDMLDKPELIRRYSDNMKKIAKQFDWNEAVKVLDQIYLDMK
ncbi:MAG: glycosyltransferase [Clostridiales bacterium]|nr:glycosyltransferase [Candidatus Scatonaster coprocaballi]